MLIVKKSSIAELEAQPNIHELLDQYAAECAIEGLPHPAAKAQTYKNIEKSGMLHVWAAFDDDLLIGYITMLASTLPHYEILVAVTESYFVTKDGRKTGAGTKLRNESEALARQLGSPGVIYSCPLGGVLARVLEGEDDCVETNRVFFKRFRNE